MPYLYDEPDAYDSGVDSYNGGVPAGPPPPDVIMQPPGGGGGGGRIVRIAGRTHGARSARANLGPIWIPQPVETQVEIDKREEDEAILAIAVMGMLEEWF